MNNKKIVIVGGGAAGWSTALMANKKMPSLDITVVESTEIGILGAGEGTVTNFMLFLQYVDLELPEFFKKTGSTFKNGAKFTNWNNDGKFFYHNFSADSVLPSDDAFFKYNVSSMLNIANEVESKDFDLVSFANNNNKSLMFQQNNTINQVGQPTVHFDAQLLAQFLKEKALERGVKRVEGRVSEISNNDHGYIKSINVGDIKLDADFVFDCTGFARLIIGSHYQTKWKSYSEYLPVNSAVPFFLDIDKDKIEPYTEAIAMKHGWMWKVPLQHRYGCGYAFDSQYISEEEAMQEIEEYLGMVPFYPRKDKGPLKFNTGCFENSWVKNCLAIGLSAGFVEPLEATSLYTVLEFLKDSLSDLESLFECDERHINDFNNRWRIFNDDIMNFIYFHYITKRDDTLFWKKFGEIDNAPQFVKDILNKWEYSIPRHDHFNVNYPFRYQNWIEVGYGLGLINMDLIKKSAEVNNFKKDYDDKLIELKNQSQYIAENLLIDHATFLKALVAKYDS
jgi:tryptophan halogenase